MRPRSAQPPIAHDVENVRPRRRTTEQRDAAWREASQRHQHRCPCIALIALAAISPGF
eukprot:CAMPEP_0119278364 /NCGR_PEP_ID=MMETSP1329-20130426/18948_1 /TAXON_ID=114041 /ORGANISM="Genus nov. species nov., Strain RCC1024" /LENGTH=57 /DNA_ID=CAMNT_0007278875 /DNA_START=17 /DNA_END=187 /DNA_ORIENTATION=+